ncbi:MAG: DUF58 domain-containing protein [Cyanobacteriota bacterium]
MENEDSIWHKIKIVEIKTKLLSEQLFSGNYRSPFKLTGLDFEEFKEYSFEDDPKYIDWKITAKKGSLHIKKFTEEKELNLVLIIDISSSVFFGSSNNLKTDIIQEISTAIAFGCMKNHIRLSLILFGKEISAFIPFGRNKNHILRIIKKIFSTENEVKSGFTDFQKPLHLLNSLKIRKSIIIMISDFLSNNFESDLLFEKEINKTLIKHKFTSIIIKDEKEFFLPKIGFVEFCDPETGEIILLDTNDISINEKLQQKEEDIIQFFKRKKVQTIELNTTTELHLNTLHIK